MLIGRVALDHRDAQPRLAPDQMVGRAAPMQPAADDDDIVSHGPAPLFARRRHTPGGAFGFHNRCIAPAIAGREDIHGPHASMCCSQGGSGSRQQSLGSASAS